MKKIILISVIFILLLTSCVNTFAASAKISIVTDTTEISPGSTFTITLHASDLSDSTDAAIVKFSYDSSVLELVSYASGDDWSSMVEGESISLSYTPTSIETTEWNNPSENDKFVSFVVMRNSSSSADQDIAQLTFKLSENAVVGSSTEIYFPYVNLSIGGDDYDGTASITLSVVESTNNTGSGGSTGNTSGSGNTNSSSSGSNSSGNTNSTGTGNSTNNTNTSSNSDNSTVSDSSLPQTGEYTEVFYIILGVILTISGILLFKYVKVKEIK